MSEVMKLRHYTARPMAAFHRDLVYLQTVAEKPHGFWVSVPGENDWVAFNEAENWWKPITYEYRIVLCDGAQVRRVEGIEQFHEFHREYAPNPLWRTWRVDDPYCIDWRRVASDHDGVVIAPYLWKRRMNAHWYYLWDRASGCIWNLHAIKDVVPVE